MKNSSFLNFLKNYFNLIKEIREEDASEFGYVKNLFKI